MLDGWTDDESLTNVIYTKISLNSFHLLANKESYYKGNLQYDCCNYSYFCPGWVAQLLGALQKAAGLIPSKDTYLGCRFNPPQERIWEATN